MAAVSWLIVMGGVGLIVVVVPTVFLLRRRYGVTHPACGKCGYPVEGLSTFNCPECGSDVRQVGIVTPGAARSLPVFPALALAWTLVLAVAAPILTLMAGGVAPNASLLKQQRTIFIQANYLNTTLEARDEGLVTGQVMQPQPAERLTVTLSNNAPGPVLRVDRQSGAWELEHNGVVQPGSGAFGPQAVRAFLIAAGGSATEPRVDDRAQDVFRCLQEMGQPAGRTFAHLGPDPQQGNLPTVTAHPTFTHSQVGGARWFQVTAFVLWLAVHVLVLVTLARWTGAPRRVAAVVIAILTLFFVAAALSTIA